MADLEVRDVVTSVLIHDGKILILHRSEKVSTYKGLWAGVSGYIEAGDMPEERALTEIEEETGIKRDDIKIIKSGDFVFTRGEGNIVWRVHPFLVESKTDRIKIDWEHTEYGWVTPEELEKYDTVPNYKQAVKLLLIGYN